MPEETQPFSRKSAQPRIRAGKACRRCNQKRIKCDAMHQMPCTNCVQNSNTNCILRESRRGTYTRRFQPRESPEAQLSTDRAPPIASPSATTNAAPVPPTIHAVSSFHDRASPEPANSPSNLPANTPPTPESANANQRPSSLEFTGVGGSPSHHSPVSSDGNASSYRDISWSAMFDHFLNSRKDSGKEFIDKCSITYLGESFPLAMVLGDLNEGGRPKLHHPGPPFPAEDERRPDVVEQLQPTHILPEDLDFLRIKGVFEFPDKAHLNAFLTVFLERVYPIYPLVNRQELIKQYTKGTIPLILLHSICFIAVTFCPLSVLHCAGFTSRRDARFFYYKKVKALFDSGYEINKIVILQSAILMSFWGGGPNNYWNFYSWISTAVTIAEGMGIHRSTATSNMQPQDTSLLRRLWWILVVRDSVCSALVGRPFRINMEQSDTEMLTIEDFAHDALVPEFLSSPQQQTYALYQLEIARLSVILRDIVMDRFNPSRTPTRGLATSLHARLMQWREELPSSLAWEDERPDHRNPFTMALSVQYHHHIILIYLGYDSIASGPECAASGIPRGDEVTDLAALHISTVACAAVTRSSVLVLPHEFFHSIFLAQTVFYTKIKSSNKLIAQLGRSALQNCQMVLHESGECWDPSPWIMQLFDSLSSRWSERPSFPTEQGQGRFVAGPTDLSTLTGGLGSTPEAGMFNGLLSYEPWQSNPMLSSLFDLPPELSLLEQ